jgi:hypothetical protein
MIELLGPMPKKFAQAGRQFRQFFGSADDSTIGYQTFRRI